MRPAQSPRSPRQRSLTASRRLTSGVERSRVRRLHLLLVLVGLASLAVVPAHAQTRKCLSEEPSYRYAAGSMSASWAVAARPCVTDGALATLDVKVTIHRCVARTCTDSTAHRHCRLRAGFCAVRAVMRHAAVEAAEYTFSWTGQATSGDEGTVNAGATLNTLPDPCVSATVVVLDCTKP